MHRVGVLNGQVVSHVCVAPYTLRYGSVRLRVVGVGWVCTHPDYRGSGYAAAVMRDAMTYMAEQGAHVALLDGRDDYYDRFGFSPVWPYYHFEVASAEAAALDSPLRLRPARPDDVPHMAELYQRHWGWRVAFVRSPEVWMWRVATASYPYIQVVEDKGGRICGYIAGQGPTDWRVETVADTPEAAMTLIGECGRRCQEAGIEHVVWPLPPDDALVTFARQWLHVKVSARYHPNGGWMARIIDTQALVEALLPELVAQASTVMPALDADALLFDCQPHAVHIGLRDQLATHCRLNYRDFIQIMFGSLRPSTLALPSDGPITPEGARLLEALFPPRMAALAYWDWF
jgi:ribosomal protein S18 acetylase RimI-like enzyme